MDFEKPLRESKTPRIKYSIKWKNLSIKGRFTSKGEGKEDLEDKK